MYILLLLRKCIQLNRTKKGISSLTIKIGVTFWRKKINRNCLYNVCDILLKHTSPFLKMFVWHNSHVYVIQNSYLFTSLYDVLPHISSFIRKINVIDNRNIWSMKSSKWVHWCVYILSFRGLYSYKHIILVTDTLVTDDSYLTLSGFYTSLFHWEKRVFTSS